MYLTPTGVWRKEYFYQQQQGKKLKQSILSAYTTSNKCHFITETHEYPRLVYIKINFLVFTLSCYAFIGGK